MMKAELCGHHMMLVQRVGQNPEREASMYKFLRIEYWYVVEVSFMSYSSNHSIGQKML